ncbi:ABC transporter permease [Beijerinckia sp. L45]|uniref:ABC transporter permease n=1 Tax=Beijerinckia sp. L45 TaxID=1641855 RepID=UPI00131BA7F6|nr:ABC transporter permease [Beijerinckia sp. L45]
MNERDDNILSIGAVRIQLRVFFALMMHDIKSRFFGSGIGYIITIVWPLTHIVIILALNAGKMVPYGSSMVLYAATACIPYIACNYIGRFMMLGVLTNRSFLQYPIIKPLDMILARAFLEIVNNSIVVATLMIAMSISGIDVTPIDPLQAAFAWIASMGLGISVGLLGGVICLAFPLFNLIFVLFIIIAWITCGMSINPELLPESYGYYFSFNPVLHCVEWMRQAYFLGSPARLLNKAYVLEVSATCLTAGFLLERFFRSFLLTPR